MSKTPEEIYREREKRVKDAIALGKPDRVPIVLLWGGFAARYAGISFEEEMNNLEKCFEANFKTNVDFAPDLAALPLFFGPMMSALDYRQLLWSGHGLSSDTSFQFLEGEYMKADEYDALLYDPTDFVMRRYWPRVFGKLKAFESALPLRGAISYYMGAQTNFLSFGLPAMAEAFEALRKAGEETLRVLQMAMGCRAKMTAAGFPIVFAAGTQAPFDTLGDFFRGTKGLMLDMYRGPDKVIAACEKLLPMMIEYAVTAAERGRATRAFWFLSIKGPKGSCPLNSSRSFTGPRSENYLLLLQARALIRW